MPELRLTRDGRWFVDGEEILHERTLRVLTENVRLTEDGTFVTSIGRETAKIVADDAAFFVRTATIDGRGLVLALSDRSEETLATPHLRSGLDGALYCRVKGDRAWARFSRAAQQALAPSLVEEAGAVGLIVCGVFVPAALF